MYSRWSSLMFGMLLVGLGANAVHAAEVFLITPENYDKIVPQGKEVDAIYGDVLIRNESLVCVVAKPVPGRNANMTVRGVAGMVIDLTRRQGGSDQLSCFYLGAGKFSFDSSDKMKVLVDGKEVVPAAAGITGREIKLSVEGKSISGDVPLVAEIQYLVRDSQLCVEYQATIRNPAEQPQKLTPQDSLRCDGAMFRFGNDDSHQLFYAEDVYWRQCYGFILDQGRYRQAPDKRVLNHEWADKIADEIPAQGTIHWSGKLYCSQGLPGVRAWASGLQNGQQLWPVQLKLQSPQGPIANARIEFRSGDRSLGTIDSDLEGVVRCELLSGDYSAIIQSHGREQREHTFALADRALAESLTLPAASRVQGMVVDVDDKPIAAKVQFLPVADTPMPDFGPDTATFAVKNLVYCALGKFEQAIAPGKYKVIVSHGPEYDVDTQDLEIRPGQLVLIKSRLNRSVDTRGWISADFHSHSTPSGDNVSSQLGRVLNLLAEHVEFAPCTEHNRIESYDEELTELGARYAMATCTGMELTGSPLPINHQNAFPLKRAARQQDGGGPVTDADPARQIERLALWDSASPKVVQVNHPNIPQMLGDRDLDGKPDDGFRSMFGWMDVIEVHPPEGIFAEPPKGVAPKDWRLNPMFYWMQLLNLGYRIPGVVNTDAHYNFHGSGWLRNYIECTTDEPSKIQVDEMIFAVEHGRMVMTTGPFLQVQLRTEEHGKDAFYTCGDEVSLGDKPARLWIRVQCPNWFDINRVQVFANGRPMAGFNFTRQSHPEHFGNNTVRFQAEFALPSLDRDTHLIVATIGEGLTLGPVMGEDRGKLPPVAVGNPIFVDVDGGGFKANGDDLGVPILLPAK